MQPKPSLRELRKLAQRVFEETSEVMSHSVVVAARTRALESNFNSGHHEALGPLSDGALLKHKAGTPAAALDPEPAGVRREQFPEVNQLTRRELEALRLIAEGKSTKEIAGQMGVRFKTAACHRANLMSKLDVHDTATLVRCAVRWGLVQP
jgi:DNA-binding NarL/FixJ family response regulator